MKDLMDNKVAILSGGEKRILTILLALLG